MRDFNFSSWLLTVFLTLILNGLFAQQTLTGEILDDTGEPLIGANIIIKGTNRGTVTDIEGKYSIVCSPGETLVFSYTGYATTETVLSEGSFRRGGKKSTLKQKKVGIITSSAYQSTIRKLRDTINVPDRNHEKIKLKKSLGNFYNIKDIKISDEEVDFVHHEKPLRYEVKLSQEGNFSFVPDGRLPEIQTRFAGGNNENGSFSLLSENAEFPQAFGPEFMDLQFDGIPTLTNPLGQLIPRVNDEAPAVQTKVPDIFPTVFLSTTNLSAKLVKEKEEIRFQLKHKRGRDIFGVTPFRQNRIGLDLIKRFNKSYISLQGAFERNRNDQSNRNGLANGIYQFAYQSPTEFPLNFLTNRQQNITASSGPFDNPFYLLENALDQNTLTRWNIGANWNFNQNRYRKELKFSAQTNISSNRQKTDFLLNGNQVGILENLKQEYRSPIWQNRVEGSYFWDEKFNAQLFVRHQFEELDYDYNKEGESEINLKSQRNNFDIVSRLNYENDDIILTNLSLYNQIFASTNDQNAFFLPGISFRLDGKKLVKEVDFMNEIFFSGELNRSVFQQPLLYQNHAWNYSDIDVFGQANYQVFPELLNPEDLALETRINYTGNLMLNGFDKLFFFNARYYYSHRKNVVGHQGILTNTVIENLATLRDQSVELSLEYRNKYYYSWNNSLRVKLIFELNRSKVISLADEVDTVVLGGNADVQQVLKEGESSGALVGTTWLKNENGERIIDENGYPMVNNERSIIGDALPDYRLKLNLTFQHREFVAGLNLTYSKGGQAWNGTLASLNFLGLSQNSADLRTMTGFVFPGVNLDGTPNTTPVNFGESNGPENGNRWQRYGPGGVGEENIEDASFLNLSSVYLRYKFVDVGTFLNDLTVKFYANNLVSWLPFAGYSPHRSFRDLDATTGIQLFNLPLSTEIGFSVQVRI